MNAFALREALDLVKEIREWADETRHGEAIQALEDAARTIALPILEADPELVERIATVLQRFDCLEPSQAARELLAAITPGAENGQ